MECLGIVNHDLETDAFHNYMWPEQTKLCKLNLPVSKSGEIWHQILHTDFGKIGNWIIGLGWGGPTAPARSKHGSLPR